VGSGASCPTSAPAGSARWCRCSTCSPRSDGRHRATRSQVALRRLIEQGAVSIPGAKNGQQAAANAGALCVALETGELDALTAATADWR
jgi:diketogulonate reductase-like aldo/keto reductase